MHSADELPSKSSSGDAVDRTPSAAQVERHLAEIHARFAVQARLLLAGTASAIGPLRRLMAELPAPGRIVFRQTATPAESRQWMAACDAMVLIGATRPDREMPLALAAMARGIVLAAPRDAGRVERQVRGSVPLRYGKPPVNASGRNARLRWSDGVRTHTIMLERPEAGAVHVDYGARPMNPLRKTGSGEAPPRPGDLGG